MLIGISGKARSGKDTFSKFLLEELNGLDCHYTMMAYADSLKIKVMQEFDLSYEQVYGSLKEEPDVRYTKQNGDFWTPREILQHIGTDSYRSVDSNFWVKQLYNFISDRNLYNVIITDCRFPEEIDPVIAKGGIHIRVTRENKDFCADINHESEMALDNYGVIDYLVENNLNLDDLKYKARKIATKIYKLGG